MSLFNISFVYDWNLKRKYTELLQYHDKSNYWNALKGSDKRNSKMKIIGPIGDTGILAKETPARVGFELTMKRKLKPSCPLCRNLNHPHLNYPINRVRVILWRGYLIFPNTLK